MPVSSTKQNRLKDFTKALIKYDARPLYPSKIFHLEQFLQQTDYGPMHGFVKSGEEWILAQRFSKKYLGSTLFMLDRLIISVDGELPIQQLSCREQNGAATGRQCLPDNFS